MESFRPHIGDYFFIMLDFGRAYNVTPKQSFRPHIGDYFFITLFTFGA